MSTVRMCPSEASTDPTARHGTAQYRDPWIYSMCRESLCEPRVGYRSVLIAPKLTETLDKQATTVRQWNKYNYSTTLYEKKNKKQNKANETAYYIIKTSNDYKILKFAHLQLNHSFHGQLF